METRAQIIDFLRRELLGPDPISPNIDDQGEEILVGDPPRIRYGAGVLFPQSSVVETSIDVSATEAAGGAAGVEAISDSDAADVQIAGEDRATTSSTEETVTEDTVGLANAFLPSALGISCLVNIPSNGLQVDINAAKYHSTTREASTKEEKKKSAQHARRSICERLGVTAQELLGPKTTFLIKPVVTSGNASGLEVSVVSRPVKGAAENQRLVTVMLVNANKSGGGRVANEKCFFQASLKLSAGGEACFLEYPEAEGEGIDGEEWSIRLLYRHRKTFAIGHGCAAEWTEVDGHASTVCSEIVPVYEVKPIVPAQLPGIDLSMLSLSDLGDDAGVVHLLSRLATKYEDWISEREEEASELSDELREVAGRHIANCRGCVARIRRGIQILSGDATAMMAFRLANRAMLLQQLHYSMPLRQWFGGSGGVPQIPPAQHPSLESPPAGKGRWFPFQLAFILINVPSQALPFDHERALVDLIWFPTGGGKTEAYLGLTAFTMFLRRLQNPNDAGVTVLMRYTLRLLTAQQFQRAAALICACDTIRAEMPAKLGSDRVSIGLWVGQGLTPNKRADATQSLRKLARGESRDNPFIVLQCPWCSAQMGPVEIANRSRVLGYELQRDPTTVAFRCPDPACKFGQASGLPLYVIDEDIYAVAPTLLIGTVDKFAMLPWRPEARSLFAVGDRKNSPPDLIIQDELHLISGPLGSMVGHFETVIDELCTRNTDGGQRRRPKIVASTATISKATEQVHALYGRPVFLFPPQCLRAGDSFFAYEDTQAAGRSYVGVHASALPSHVTTQVRVFAALLQAGKSAHVTIEAERDPYFTLVTYFNSLRELGHAATLLRADIPEYLNAMWLRKGIKGEIRRFINNGIELTSRIPSSEIPESLQMLERVYPLRGNEFPVDVCLATNMISVGVDVPRLGLMAVVGQPKTTSEYIQATSRVGRKRNSPGVVVTIYHTGKPRDRSHYEHFRSYHAALYRGIEPTSVTPFAAPVRDRALHALAVTLVRFLGSEENRVRPQPYPPAELLNRIEEIIANRVATVDADEEQLTVQLLSDVLDRWRNVLPPRYGDFGAPQAEIPLMYPAGSQPLDEWLGKSLPTPTSMRSVDADCEAGVIGKYPQPSEEA